MSPGNLIGLGLDLVDIGRFARVLGRRPAMAHRLFTAHEQAYGATFANPAPALAARFAVKESVMKALGVGLGAFDFTDVEVRRRPSGQPCIEVSGRAALLAIERGVGSWSVSISHTDTLASAIVAALA